MFLSCMSAQIHKCAVLSTKWKISFLVLVYLTLHLLDISDKSRKREKPVEFVFYSSDWTTFDRESHVDGVDEEERNRCLICRTET